MSVLPGTEYGHILQGIQLKEGTFHYDGILRNTHMEQTQPQTAITTPALI